MKNILAAVLVLASCLPAAARTDVQLKTGWQFSKDSTKWESVTIPHDWAIYGPFSRDNDLQKVVIEQNGETEATWKTGRTGGLPYVGKGYYKTTFSVPDTAGKALTLLFDGAMSHAHVYVNGRHVAYWPYGYNSFTADLDGVARPGLNTLEVSLENLPRSSRWYPGAGLYRNVHLITTDRVHIPVWGVYLTTPYIGPDYADVRLQTTLRGLAKGQKFSLATTVTDARGQVVATDTRPYVFYPGVDVQQFLKVRKPHLWSPETPYLYSAATDVVVDGNVVDTYHTRFGIRTVEVRAGDGFYLNGKKRKFQGVNNHHDLGPLGAAVNTAALRHQLLMLKDMGADAVRTSHNMPAPELVRLCDELGLMLMVEPFDDWGFRPKSENGYGTLFNEWAERDIENMVRAYRSSPSVVMWSIGNEVPSQWGPDGLRELTFLQDIVRREDPTRPVTQGMDQFDAVVNNGFAAAMQVPSFNYKVNRYPEAIAKLPQGVLLGTETASTLSSRGVYHFPVRQGKDVIHPDHQSSSYDVEASSWANLPDDDFLADDSLDYNMGQFVWTGFDYLGEPAPYDTDAWPNHSSLYGIIDLASLPKDRYYLYRSRWNRADNTLHILPHWTWPGREGEITPVFVYTNFPKAELFINGKSQGFREKNDSTRQHRYRLMWNDVVYQPGEVTVVAYDAAGNRAAEQTVRTAGKPYALRLTSSVPALKADGEDLAYITVQAVDKAGNPVPYANEMVNFKVKGAGRYRAAANGDPTSLDLFHLPRMPLFSGACTAILQSGDKAGTVTLTATAKGMKPATITLPVNK
ncbi:MAG: glycoside hydrolase family 2 TIM barrel-domain containing protein [Lepagella sp.]